MRRLPRTIVVYIASLIVMAAVTAFRFNRLPPEIPLLYSLPASSSQVVDIWFVAVIPFMALLSIITNNYVSKKMFKEDVFVRRITYAANMTIIIFFTYIYIKIIILVS